MAPWLYGSVTDRTRLCVQLRRQNPFSVHSMRGGDGSTPHPSVMLISGLKVVRRWFKILEAQHPPLTPNSSTANDWTTMVLLVLI